MIPLGLACRQSMAAYLEADDIFGITRQGLDYFTGLFAGDFPFAKYDQVFVPDNAGAMENVGLRHHLRVAAVPVEGDPPCTRGGPR